MDNMRHRQRQPFFEGPSSPSLVRRALAEGVATAALTMTVVLSTQATWLGALQPLAICLGVPAAVAALTLSFGPATGAHFNPLITASQWLRGHRDSRCLIAYICAQFVGAWVGAALAALLVSPAPHIVPAPIGVVIGSEVFASAGLITIVLAASLVTGPLTGLLAVVGWLVMVNLAAPGGPFANPVLAFSTSLALGSMNASLLLAHVAAEFAGALLALLIIAVTYPGTSALASAKNSQLNVAKVPAEPM
jgi:glycerol uptake facilitator-like aquaporin